MGLVLLWIIEPSLLAELAEPASAGAGVGGLNLQRLKEGRRIIRKMYSERSHGRAFLAAGPQAWALGRPAIPPR